MHIDAGSSAFRPPDGSLHIYTQNVFGLPFTRRTSRFRALASRIGALKADIVFLQEVLFGGDERHFEAEGYHVARVGRGPWNAGGLVILSRVPLQRVRFQAFREQGAWHSRQLTDRLLGKGWIEAEAEAWGVTLVNTHLVSTYQEPTGFVADRAQRAQLAELLGAVSGLGPAILGGDFNFTEGTPFHRLALDRLDDVARGTHRPAAGLLLPKLDHVFVRGLDWLESHARLVHPGVVGGRRARPCSDHAGVSVRLFVGRPAPGPLAHCV
jgi:endonuclease/exonuclease/phosphatase family metal-dependent hydrolase